MNQKYLLLLILFGIITGFGGGYAFAMIQNKQAVENLEREFILLPRADSAVAWRSDISGKIAEIKEDFLTLQAGAQTISVKIPPDLKITNIIMEQPSINTPKQQEKITASDLNIGDAVLASVTADEEGSMRLEQLTVLPAFTQ